MIERINQAALPGIDPYLTGTDAIIAIFYLTGFMPEHPDPIRFSQRPKPFTTGMLAVYFIGITIPVEFHS